MSLEAALKENTEALNRLAEILASGVISTPKGKTPDAPVAEEPKPEPKAKAEKTKKPEPKVEAPVVPYEKVAAAITALIQAGRRDKAVEILSSYGVQNGKGLKPEQYAEALAKFEAANG